LLEYLNTTLRTAEEAAQFLHLPSLGTISHIAHTKDKLQDALLQHQEVFSPALEEYRLLYSKLNFLFTDQAHKVILVTSSSAGEGKSVTVANLAILMAQAGHQTIILDANLRAPMQHILFNLREAGGLTNLLNTPHLKLDGKLKQTRVNNLSVVTCGDLHLARPEQLSSDRTALLVAALYNLADIVLIDCPETVTVADVPLLVQQVDGVLLVIGSGQTRRDKALQAVDNLQQANAHILGVVVNNARSGRKTFAPSASTVQPPVNTVVKQSAHLKM
jgi:capsular exopolysaccharide synthesis family protein